jgi:putative spermidine/putrescine transport system permease protein
MQLVPGEHPFRIQGLEFWQPYLLLLPALSLIGLLFVGGLGLALLQSVGLITPTGSSHLTLAAYGQVLTDPEFGRSLTLSLYLAFLATGLSLLVSIGLALLLQKAAAWASFACQITLPIPHLVGVVGILMLLSPSGLIARLLFQLGWIQSDQDFPLLVNDAGNLGVLIHFLWKEIPFATLILLSVLKGIGSAYDMQARVLGANAWQTFWYVTLPLLRSGILSAGILIFGFILASFEVPFLLGSTYPRTLPVQIYRYFTDVDLNQRTEAIALGIILAVISFGISAVYLWIGQKWSQTHAA